MTASSAGSRDATQHDVTATALAPRDLSYGFSLTQYQIGGIFS